MKSSQKKNSKVVSRPEIGITSLGVPLRIGENGTLRLDLTDLKLFKGLSVLAGMLGEEILDQARKNTDIVVQHRVLAEITPQLSTLGIAGVSVTARKNVLKSLPNYRKEFHTQLRAVFGTLQRPAWGGVLFPEFFEQVPGASSKTASIKSNSPDPPGLLFPYHLHFEQSDIDYFFLVERDIEGKFIRITIENDEDGRLDLSKIPHVVVSDLDRRTFLQGLTRMAESIQTGIRRECENFQTEHTEDPGQQPQFFEQLAGAGLASCEIICVHWPMQSEEYLLSSPPEENVDFLRRCLLVLEDRQIISHLSDRLLEVDANGRRAFIDLSRRGRSLNISLDQPRRVPQIERFLQKMPLMESLSLARKNSMKDVRVFLIHHITGEILATIRALENMGCDFLRVQFVKYAGMVPAEYLETLLSLPEDQFRFHGLNKIEPSGSVEGYYVLSRQYSPMEEYAPLDKLLSAKRLPFFEAMQLAAGYFFFLESFHCTASNKKLLLIEDGGYLAPQINSMCLEGKTVRQALEYYGLDLEMAKKNPNLQIPGKSDMDGPLSKWLSRLLVGSVEHTRNGYDRLAGIQNKFGKLQFPAASIAISRVKREMESREVSVSVLHAIESILHGQGLVLSNRKALILGSRGAIGTCLIDHLKFRIAPDKIFGVDSVIEKSSDSTGVKEVNNLKYLEENDFLDLDIVIGVIGKSIFEDSWIQDLILRGKRPSVFFASGSTKTLEFTHLSQYIEKIRKSSKVGDKTVRIHSDPIRDPQTGLIQGTKVRIEWEKKKKDLYLMGGLTPINFLYYGVPTETMDPVLTQLLQVAAGMLRQKNLPAGLLAVDHEVTVDAELIR